MRVSSLTMPALLMAGALVSPLQAYAQENGTHPRGSEGRPSPPETAVNDGCSVATRAEAGCDTGSATRARPASPRTTRHDSTAHADRDSLWEGALLGGAVGLGAAATVALLADCPNTRRSGSCVSDRAALLALSAALGAGVGLGMDAIIGPEFTGAPLPGPPASERRVGLPPPSSRGAGVRFRLAW